MNNIFKLMKLIQKIQLKINYSLIHNLNLILLVVLYLIVK